MSSSARTNHKSAQSKTPRPVGRPRVDPSESASRIAILDAAETLFAKRGFDATPTREIAKKAKVTTGLVFYYFPTKKSLLKSLVEERSALPRITNLLTGIDENAPVGDFPSVLRTTGRDLYDVIRGSDEMVRIVTSEVPHHRYIRRHWEEMLESVLVQLTAYLSRVSGGSLSVESAAPLARVFFSTIAFHAIFDPDHDRDQLIDGLLAAVAYS